MALAFLFVFSKSFYRGGNIENSWLGFPNYIAAFRIIQGIQKTFLICRQYKLDCQENCSFTQFSLAHKTGPFLISLLRKHLIVLNESCHIYRYSLSCHFCKFSCKQAKWLAIKLTKFKSVFWTFQLQNRTIAYKLR